jgi:NAD+ diphosphatase
MQGVPRPFADRMSTSAVALLRNADGRFPVIRRDKEPGMGLLDLPGGFVEPGESVEAA